MERSHKSYTSSNDAVSSNTVDTLTTDTLTTDTLTTDTLAETVSANHPPSEDNFEVGQRQIGNGFKNGFKNSFEATSAAPFLPPQTASMVLNSLLHLSESLQNLIEIEAPQSSSEVQTTQTADTNRLPLTSTESVPAETMSAEALELMSSQTIATSSNENLKTLKAEPIPRSVIFSSKGLFSIKSKRSNCSRYPETTEFASNDAPGLPVSIGTPSNHVLDQEDFANIDHEGVSFNQDLNTHQLPVDRQVADQVNEVDTIPMPLTADDFDQDFAEHSALDSTEKTAQSLTQNLTEAGTRTPMQDPKKSSAINLKLTESADAETLPQSGVARSSTVRTSRIRLSPLTLRQRQFEAGQFVPYQTEQMTALPPLEMVQPQSISQQPTASPELVQQLIEESLSKELEQHLEHHIYDQFSQQLSQNLESQLIEQLGQQLGIQVQQQVSQEVSQKTLQQEQYTHQLQEDLKHHLQSYIHTQLQQELAQLHQDIQQQINQQTRSQTTSQSPAQVPGQTSQQHQLNQLTVKQLQELETRLAALEKQFNGVAEENGPVMPVINEILRSLTPTSLRQEVISSLVPVIDRVIRDRTRQNRSAMSEAIAEVLPLAISRHIQSQPCEIAAAIAPEMAEALRRQIALAEGELADAISSEMGSAIKKQVALERESMVDALYPVIGNTISKYLTEEIRTINAKVEQSFSLEGISRKLRARIHGVSEAELILQESRSFNVKAAFLIHKESGLVIAEAQQVSEHQLEADMIGGMLTAIRSFANDCIAQADSGHVSELNEIEYDNFKLVLEVAGYCYIALVIKGSISKPYLNHLRIALSKIVQNYGIAIKKFDGDPSTINEEVFNLIQDLVPTPIETEKSTKQSHNNPPALLLIIISGIAVLSILGARQAWLRRVETQVLRVIDKTPELTIYQLNVRARGHYLELTGDLPYRSLQEKLVEVVSPLVPDRQVIDHTQLASFEPDDSTVAAAIDRLTELLNKTLPATIVTHYADGRVTLQGWAEDEQVLQTIGTAFADLPGVRSVSSTLMLDASPSELRFFFDQGQAIPTSQLNERKLSSIARFLANFPDIQLKVIGHADRTGTPEQNKLLSLARAQVIRQNLLKLGINPNRLIVEASLKLPPGITPEQPDNLSRCVRFEVVPSSKSSTKN